MLFAFLLVDRAGAGAARADAARAQGTSALHAFRNLWPQRTGFPPRLTTLSDFVFEVSLPRVVFGVGALRRLPGEMKALGLARPWSCRRRSSTRWASASPRCSADDDDVRPHGRGREDDRPRSERTAALGVYDLELSAALPFAITVVSLLNAIAHAAEGLYAPDRNPLVEAIAEEGIRTAQLRDRLVAREAARRDQRKTHSRIDGQRKRSSGVSARIRRRIPVRFEWPSNGAKSFST